MLFSLDPLFSLSAWFWEIITCFHPESLSVAHHPHSMQPATPGKTPGHQPCSVTSCVNLGNLLSLSVFWLYHLKMKMKTISPPQNLRRIQRANAQEELSTVPDTQSINISYCESMYSQIQDPHPFNSTLHPYCSCWGSHPLLPLLSDQKLCCLLSFDSPLSLTPPSFFFKAFAIRPKLLLGSPGDSANNLCLD